MVVQVRRPRVVVFDILGTASKSGFLEKILFPFLKVNLDSFVATNWDKTYFKSLFNKIRDQSIEFNQREPITPVVQPHDAPDARQTLMNFIDFVTDNGINAPSVTQLRFRVWFEGYQQSKIRTPIYKDVPAMLRKWFAEGIKFYVFSNTWVEAQKALLKNTNHGDLTNLISGNFDNDFGPIHEAESWRQLCVEVHESPNNVLFLTKSVVEARAAQQAGVEVVMVLTHRHNVKALSAEDRKLFPYVRTMNDIMWLEEAEALGVSATPLPAMRPNGGNSAGAHASQQDRVGTVPTAVSTSSNMPSARSGSSASGVLRSKRASSRQDSHSNAAEGPSRSSTATQKPVPSSSSPSVQTATTGVRSSSSNRANVSEKKSPSS